MTETSVHVTKDTRESLFALKQGPGDTYDDVIQRLLDKNGVPANGD